MVAHALRRLSLWLVIALAVPLFACAGTYGSGSYGSGSYAGIPPTVTTQAASSIAETSAVLNGTITDIGTTSPAVRGFVYGTDSTYGATTTDSAGPFSTGAFTATLSNLSCNATYHYAAFATSTDGYGYGSDVSFTTSACPSSSVSTPSNGGGNGPIVGSMTSMVGHPIVPEAPVATTSTSTASSTISTSAVSDVERLRARISEILAKIASLGGVPSSSNGASAASTSFTRNLQLNDSGADVLALQKHLNASGFKVAESGAGSPGFETRKFGPATYRALVRFQSAKGLSPTGFFGPQTRALVSAN